MNIDPEVPLAISIPICLILALMVTAVHDETLRLINRGLLSQVTRPRRWHVGATMLILLVAHVIEIVIYGIGMHAVSLYWPEVNALVGGHSNDLMTYIYFSFSCYTSLGIGDLQPVGHLRLFAGMEALVGLLMIGWTASYILLEMRALWALNMEKSAESATAPKANQTS